MPQLDGRPPVLKAAVRHHWRPIAAAAIVLAVIAFGVAQLRSPRHTATATVLLQPAVGNAFSTAAPTNSQTTTTAMQTEASLVDSAAVTQRVNAKLHMHLRAGSADIVATVPDNTQIVRIAYTARTASGARQIAQAYAVAFLDYRSGLADAAKTAQLTGLNRQAAAVQRLLQAAAKAASGPKPSADASSKVQLYANRLESIQSNLDQAKATGTAPGSVATPARDTGGGLSSLPSTLPSWVFGLIGLIVGGALGLAVAVWRERRDDHFRAAARDSLGIPVTGAVRFARKSAGGAGVEVEHGSDDVRLLRVGLLASVPVGSVLAVAPTDSQGLSLAVAAELARAVSRAGYRVMLVDAIPSANGLARRIGIPEAPGLSDLLGQSADPHTTELGVEVEGMRVLPAGLAAPSLRDRLSGDALATLIAGLRGEYDYTIVCTAPVTTSDGLAVARLVDQVLLVVRDGATRRSTIMAAAVSVQRVSTTGVAVVAALISRGALRRAGRASAAPATTKSRAGQVEDEPTEEPTPDASAPPDVSPARDQEPTASATDVSDDGVVSPDDTIADDTTTATDDTVDDAADTVDDTADADADADADKELARVPANRSAGTKQSKTATTSNGHAPNGSAPRTERRTRKTTPRGRRT